ncbi:unnamed protein product [Symbiodinium natans]|uniref:Uncharacterized protein n=1 Tax=Symbiodinium natans TaxID=878477 RepID=A0A812KX99_9DINO|nr:unnamed protein product [Symbiodinium natans]
MVLRLHVSLWCEIHLSSAHDKVGGGSVRIHAAWLSGFLVTVFHVFSSKLRSGLCRRRSSACLALAKRRFRAPFKCQDCCYYVLLLSCFSSEALAQFGFLMGAFEYGAMNV